VLSMMFIMIVLSETLFLCRYDLASPTRELLVQSVSLQTGTICVLFYFAGLIVSLVMAHLDEHITLEAAFNTNVTV